MRKLFKDGMKAWSDTTCIDFVEDDNGASHTRHQRLTDPLQQLFTALDKVVLIKEPGIFSSIGRLGGDQFLSLGDGSATVRCNENNSSIKQHITF